jgi:hypothetical protein
MFLLATFLGCAVLAGAAAKAKSFDVTVTVDTATSCGSPCNIQNFQGVNVAFPTVALDLGDGLDVAVGFTTPLFSRGLIQGPMTIWVYANGAVQDGEAFETNGGLNKIQNEQYYFGYGPIESILFGATYYGSISPGETVYVSGVTMALYTAPEMPTWVMFATGFLAVGFVTRTAARRRAMTHQASA